MTSPSSRPAHPGQEIVEFTGIIDRVIFTNDDESYSIASFVTDQDAFVICGYIPILRTFEEYRIAGTWRNHPKYGRQLELVSVFLVIPSDLEGIERYLASGVVRGIGAKTAHQIVAKFGLETFDVIEHRPERLLEIRGIGNKTLDQIVASFSEQSFMRENLMFFQSIGVSNLLAATIFRDLGTQAVAEVRRNPYILAEFVRGIGFQRADEIALRLGVEPDSEFRIAACVRHLLQSDVKNGHTFSWADEVMQRVAEVIAGTNREIAEWVEIDLEQIEAVCLRMTMDGQLEYRSIEERDAFYLPELFHMEHRVAELLFDLSMYAEPIAEVEGFVEQYEERYAIRLDVLQKDAIRCAFHEGVFVVTGGPGTGKTTIINAIINAYESRRKKVALAAPTGRAAKRMSEATGKEAKTIHRLLEASGTGFGRNDENPLSENVVVIDEISMIDIFLMYRLLSAIKRGTILVLVGDRDQLPSVGAGAVLKDVIACGRIPVIKLERIFRQAEESMIAINAHRINCGEMPIVNNGKDFYMIRKERSGITAEIIELVSERLPKTYSFDPVRDIQVMSFTYKNESGVTQLNEELQKTLNPPSPYKPELKLQSRLFRVGDKVMQTANNYEIEWRTPDGGTGEGIFNGDIGVVTDLSAESREIRVLFDDGRAVSLTFEQAQDLVLAYAITVHKSQGSEFPCVVIPVLDVWGMMHRNIIYTAITRARQLVVLVGSPAALQRMVGNEMIDRRRTNLCALLESHFAQIE
ncbi:MAG: ATP-dependent RecD-like DNA helicase [Bacillota bacterium]|nr:ATP-dependent RecD-like DNA helicase [Bacillota bacterium]